MADELKGEAWHSEQRRKSQDLIRVCNPTAQDYILIWDREKFIIPHKDHDMGWGKGMRVMQRYLAEKYCREMKNQMINELADNEVKERVKRLSTEGNVDPVYFANEQLKSSKYRTDNTELSTQYINMCWLGIEEE